MSHRTDRTCGLHFFTAVYLFILGYFVVCFYELRSVYCVFLACAALWSPLLL